MENGSTLGTYIAYGVIVLFLLLLTFVVARTVLLYSLLLVRPIAQAWSWVRGSRSARHDDDVSPGHTGDGADDR